MCTTGNSRARGDVVSRYVAAMSTRLALIFGGFMDSAHYGAVLVGIAVLQVAAVFTALKVGRS